MAVALTIAGSDPSGGAGIQADLKTFARFGVYGEAAITLITVQNTECVAHVQPLPPSLVIDQIQAVVKDIPPSAAKTGALGTVEIVEAVAELMRSFSFQLVVDPVMISKHGAPLLNSDAARSLTEKLFPAATLVMPNIPEAEALAGMKIATESEMVKAAERILETGCVAVLIKGGHLPGEPLDVLRTPDRVEFFRNPRIHTRHTHGTGCTYSAAVTAKLSLGIPLVAAVAQARSYVQQAIATAPALGHGHGPLNHFA